KLSEAEQFAFRKPILDDYESKSSCIYSSARLWDDGVIDPARTRDILGITVYANHSQKLEYPRYGIFRM
ncbi:hypothetical protein LEP1GSC150_4460, partial [Leptospira interrogans serovar Copenhageni str. LT2050]